jgi:hypothetical protein
VMAQTGSGTDTIYKLNFQYYDGFYMLYTNKLSFFDKYNFPNNISQGIVEYKFSYYKDSTRLVRYVQKGKYDSFDVKTFLNLNEKGMEWWMYDDSLAKYRERHHTQAIHLPLYKGKVWKTWLNDTRAEVECITTDTLIKTPLGNKRCFGIRYFMTLPKTKQLPERTVEFREYYEAGLGKVYSIVITYYELKETKRVYRLSEEEVMISKIEYR